MRHLHRLYFDNLPSEYARDQFVALFDMGTDNGNHVYNTAGGQLVSLDDILTAAQYLVAAQCFFKLPVGASAVVDIYIPVDPGETAKTFDYQVFKSKKILPTDEQSAAVKRSSETLANLISKAEQDADTSQGPAGPSNAFGMTGASGSCSLGSGPSGPATPCGGQTSRTCSNPSTTIARCIDGSLECRAPSILSDSGTPPSSSRKE